MKSSGFHRERSSFELSPCWPCFPSECEEEEKKSHKKKKKETKSGTPRDRAVVPPVYHVTGQPA